MLDKKHSQGLSVVVMPESVFAILSGQPCQVAVADVVSPEEAP